MQAGTTADGRVVIGFDDIRGQMSSFEAGGPGHGPRPGRVP